MATSSASRLTLRRRSKCIFIALNVGVLTSLRIHDLEIQGLYSNPIQYYDFIQNRVMVLFRPKFEEPDPQANPDFSLVLSKKQNYDVVCGSDSHDGYLPPAHDHAPIDVSKGR
jgi:hypothetical protein